MGSFVNALVWRIHEQYTESGKKKPDKTYLKRLSVTNGRSMCPNCKHALAARDLIPLLSWLSLKGRCRYCNKPIPVYYPAVEVFTALLFAASYLWWPIALNGNQIVVFVFWLVITPGLIALLIYDLRWMLLPSRIIYPLGVFALTQAVVAIVIADQPVSALVNTVLAVIVGGGIFYVLYQVSRGKWIGGGDVRLGWLLGLLAATPARSFLFIFLAAIIGSLVSLPLLLSGRVKKSSVIPFGPFLIISIFIVQLFGADILHWYQHTFLTF